MTDLEGGRRAQPRDPGLAHDGVIPLRLGCARRRQTSTRRTTAGSVSTSTPETPDPLADPRPQVLYSQSGSSTYAANYLQGLMAIPQFREAIIASQYTERGDAKLYTSKLGSHPFSQAHGRLDELAKLDRAAKVRLCRLYRDRTDVAGTTERRRAEPASSRKSGCWWVFLIANRRISWLTRQNSTSKWPDSQTRCYLQHAQQGHSTTLWPLRHTSMIRLRQWERD